MATEPHNLTPKWKTKKPFFTIIGEWIIRAWGLISEETIINSLRQLEFQTHWPDEDCVWKKNKEDESSKSISKESSVDKTVYLAMSM
jgi:hypothetical protein